MNFDLEKSIAVLDRTPAALRTLLSGLPPEWIRANEGPETWCAFDVVGHLIDGEEKDWIARARIILSAGPNRRFEPFDRFRHLARNKGRSLEDLLDEFARLRAANVRTLRGLAITPAQLAMTGEHPTFGEVTLAQLLATWVVHDLGHLAQISRVMAKRYSEDVGPWKAFLPVLTR